MTEDTDIYQVVMNMLRTREWSSYAKNMSAFCIHIQRNPETILRLLNMFLDEPSWEEPFFEKALSFLPMEDWPSAMQMAITALRQNADQGAAQRIIRCASLQCPSVVHPYLEQLFPIMGDDLPAAFRETNIEQVRFLFDTPLYQEASSSEEMILSQAFQALLETRLPEALAFVQAHDNGEFSYYLPLIGYEKTSTGFRQLYPSQVFHLAFDPAYLSQILLNLPTKEDKCHPTWVRADARAPRYRFGGWSDTRCGTCGNNAHHLITLDPIPPTLGITELPSIELVVCLSCLTCEQEIVSYQHDKHGKARDIHQRERTLSHRFSAPSLKETEVNLLANEGRWRWQEWGQANGRENLHRMGGHPSWIQNAEYPPCPVCGKTSSFLMQLDSFLPTSDDGEWLWGTGGTGYAFWCDACKVSSFLEQST